MSDDETPGGENESLEEILARVTAEEQSDDSSGDEDDLDAAIARLTDPQQMVASRPAAPSYLDAGLDAALAGPSAPAWLGMRWRDIPAEMQQEAWVDLRRWTDWFINDFRIPATVIPACWFRHTELVTELHAAMNMEWKAWAEGDPTVNPMWMWIPQARAMIERCRAISTELGCGETPHTEEERMEREYDSALWDATIFTRRETRTVPRPTDEDGVVLVRARVVDGDGVIAATSNVGGAGCPREAHADTGATLTGDGVSGGDDTRLRVTLHQVPADAMIVWETASSEDGPWQNMDTMDEETSEADETGQ